MGYKRTDRLKTSGEAAGPRWSDERSDLEKDLAREAAVNRAMAELAGLLLREESQYEIASLTLEMAKKLTGSRFGYVGYIDSETGYLVCPTMTKDIWDSCEVSNISVVFEHFAGLWGWVLKHKQPLLTNMPFNDLRSSGVPNGHMHIERFLSVPAIINDELVGQVSLANADRDYSENDLYIVQRLTDLFALAIQHWRRAKELKDAKEAAEAANRAKSQFLAPVSHEIRTPMNAIIGFTDITLETELTLVQREYLSLVRSSAGHLLNLINEILDLSTIEAGTTQLKETVFHLRSNLEYLLVSSSLLARDKGLDLLYRVHPDTPDYLTGDIGRLRQVILNLVNNAVKFTKEGEILLPVCPKGCMADEVVLQFEITDTGIGIPIEKQKDIFEAFYQAEEATTRQYGGPGLGLNICKKIVLMMNGEIWVDSAPGQGSTFTARFKLAAHSDLEMDIPEKRGAFQEQRPLGRPYSNISILLAEDNPVNQKLVLTILQKKGYRVTVAMNGREAIEAFKNQDFDLILMDVEMPEINGIDTARIIRNHQKQEVRRLPIVAMTAHAMKGDENRFIEAGMDGYIAKPINRRVLLETIEKMVRP